MSAPDLKTVPVNFIRFHGLTLLVVENGGVEYVPLKPLSDLAGIDWRNTKKSMERPRNVKLLGAQRLNEVVFAGSGGDVTPPTRESWHIRLDRARMYLARINTELMASHGNVDAADVLLDLQIEWAKVLHDYETHGVARKKSVKDDQAVLMQLMKTRELANAVEKPVFTAMIHRQMKEMGFAVEPDPQGSLDLAR